MTGRSDYGSRLKASEWEVRSVPLDVARRIVRRYHYARGASNTATYCHGLFPVGSLWHEDCAGVAWWIPPTKSAAMATSHTCWQGVLALSRLVIVPGVPKNACTFLLARSMRLIDRAKWPVLVTYADEWQGHTGGIYRAANWRYVGRTNPEPTFMVGTRLISRKRGDKTRTRDEMAAIGARQVGSFAKHKFVHEVSR